MRVAARRFEHWLESVTPLAGPTSLLWLQDRHGRLVGLDRTTGARVVDEDGSGAGTYTVADDRVQERATAISHELDLDRAVLVRQGPVPRDVPLPPKFPARATWVRHAGHDVWLVHHPSRGKVKTRLARLVPHDAKPGPTIELGIDVGANAAFSGDLVAVHDDHRCRLTVLRGADVLHEVPSHGGGSWFSAAARGEDIAMCGHLAQRADGKQIVVVTVMAMADGSRRRSFGLRTQGATYVLLTDQDLIISQYSDVIVIPRAGLASIASDALEIVIDDIATPAPRGHAGRQATVSMVGASTGLAFAVGTDGKRKRLVAGGGPVVTVGATITIDDEDGQTINRWRLLDQEPATLAPGKRCFEPIPWSELQVLIRDDDKHRTSAPVPATEANPEASFCTSIDYDVSVTDPDTDESIGETEILQALDGLRERSRDVLDILFEDEHDARLALVAVLPVLRFDSARGDLRFSFEFYSNANPLSTDIERMRAAAERLRDGGWGGNYEFARPDDISGCTVFIGSQRT